MFEEKAIDFLYKDFILNIDMIESINRKNGQLISVTDKGVLLYNTACEAYMISTEDEETAEKMIDSVVHADIFVAHQDFYTSKIKNKFSLEEYLICHQAAYLSKRRLPSGYKKLDILQLDETYIPVIMNQYSHKESEDYMYGRIKSGTMYGAFVKNKLAGFIGMHSEGSLGMLEVLPEYKRQGIGFMLEAYMTNMVLEKGFIPFSQIIIGNDPSIALHKKLNFSISNKIVRWIM